MGQNKPTKLLYTVCQATNRHQAWPKTELGAFGPAGLGHQWWAWLATTILRIISLDPSQRSDPLLPPSLPDPSPLPQQPLQQSSCLRLDPTHQMTSSVDPAWHPGEFKTPGTAFQIKGTYLYKVLILQSFKFWALAISVHRLHLLSAWLLLPTGFRIVLVTSKCLHNTLWQLWWCNPF